MKFFETTLANNLTIIGEPREASFSSAVGFFVKTGARDETTEVSGVSHFLEHMMFKGTAKRSALEVSEHLAAIGAQANAFTSEEQTVYYATLLPEYLTQGIEILGDMLRPSLAEQEFDVEKKVILEEIALYKDKPTFVLFESAVREFFGEHPAGNSVLGSTQSIAALKQEQMKQYFEARYTPSNTVLAVSGKFDWDAVVEAAQKYCGHWVDRPVKRQWPVHVPKLADRKLTKENLQLSHLCLVAPGPEFGGDYRYDISVLSCILGDSSGSRCFWELIDKGIADSASISNDEMDHAGFIYAYASCLPDRLEKVEVILRNILAGSTKIQADELARAKTKISTRLALQAESSRSRMMSIGSEWSYTKTYTEIEEEVRLISEVSVDSISQALEKFSLEPTARICLVPQ
jgi:predicted Zn-dependent peptidase